MSMSKKNSTVGKDMSMALTEQERTSMFDFQNNS